MNGRPLADLPAPASSADSSATECRADLARLMAAIGCSVVQFWLAVPLTSLVLSHRGIGAGVIGLFAMMPWVAVLSVLPFTPRLVRRFGAIAIFRAGMVTACAAMILLMLTDGLTVWFAANFLNGAGAALRWVVSDTLVIAAAPTLHRGRILGIYETVLGGCLLAAPFLLSLTGSGGLLPFAVAAALPLLAILPTIGFRAPALTMSDIRPLEIAGIAARYALPLLTILLCGIVACSSYSLFPIYGRALGLSEREAALWMAVFGFGAVACQYAIGWLCDRWQHDFVHRTLIGLVTAGLLLLPALDAGGPLLWLFGFFFGGVVTGLYTITMYLSGNAARSGELLTLIMAVTLTYTLGSIAGPVVAGWAMEILPPQGLPVSLGAASLLVIAAMLLLQRRPAPHCKAARRSDKLRAHTVREGQMKSRISWVEGRTFIGESGSGHMITLGRAETPDGGNKLISPMELVLMGAGGCTAFDVVHILEKGRDPVTGCVAELEAVRAETEPKVFTKIHIHFIVTGKGLDARKVERAIQLSAEKYCSATAMLGRTAAITHDFEVREA